MIGNREFVFIGAACLMWSIVMTVIEPNSNIHLHFLVVGFLLILAPVYTRVRFEKNQEGIKFYLVTPTTKEIIELEKARFELKEKLNELRSTKEVLIEGQEVAQDSNIEITRLEAKLAEKEKELSEKSREVQKTQSTGFLSIIGFCTVGFVLVVAGLSIFDWYEDSKFDGDALSKSSDLSEKYSVISTSESSIFGLPVSLEMLDYLRKGNLAKGYNFDLKKDTDVNAIGGGIVVYAGNGLPAYGNLIIIKHDESYISVYAKTESIAVKEGEKISKGQKIAATKSRGLWFEVRYKGKPIPEKIDELLGLELNFVK